MGRLSIQDIDKNLRITKKLEREDIAWYDVREAPFTLYGLEEPTDKSMGFHRLPLPVAEATSPGVRVLNFNTAGGLVRFSTDSPFVCVRAIISEGYAAFSHMPITAAQGLDLYKAAPNCVKECYVGTFIPPYAPDTRAFEAIANVGEDGLCHYTLNFPLYGTLQSLHVGIKEGSVLSEGRPFRWEEPVVFYGSSVTQGGCASRPGNCYIAKLSQKHNLYCYNLGFSGSACGEQAIIDHLSQMKMRAFVCDYDYNAPSPEHLQKTLPRLYAAIRAAKPTLPVIFASSPVLPGQRPRRHEIVRRVYEEALAKGEPVYYVDGWQMFSSEGEWETECTVDGCHPNDLGFYRMFLAFEPALVRALGL